MSKKEKLVERLLSKPTDFTFNELTTLMGQVGYTIQRSGISGGSRVTFVTDEGDYIRIHKPHPRNELLLYQINDIISVLSERGLI